MNPQTTRTILIGMVLGVVLGGVAGYLLPDVMISISVIGRLYLNALQILLLPLIASTIVVGVTGLGSPQKLGRAAVSALYYFVGTTVIAVVIGLVLAFIMNPGGNVSAAGGFIPDMVTRARATTFTDIFSAFIPANLIESITSGQYLGLVVFTLFFAGVLMVVGRKAGLILDFFRVIGDATQRLIELVLFISPFGLFALVGAAVARNPESLGGIAGGMSWLAITFVVALLIQGAIVLPLLLRFMGHQSIGSFLKNTSPALLNALGTASTAATLPITYTAVVDVSKVDNRAGALVLPLGTVMNFNGTAIYLTVAAVFVAQVFNLQLGLIDIFNVAVLSVLLSIGTAGIPGTAPFSLAILFSLVGYPVEAFGAIGLLVIVDWLFDRGRAVLNVWGDAVGAAVVGETFEFKTAHMAPGAHAESRTERTSTDRSQHGRRDSRSKSDSRSTSSRPTRETKTRERKPRERTQTSRGSDRRSSSDRSKSDSDRTRGRGRQARSSDTRTARTEPAKQREPLKPPPLPHEKKAEPVKRPEPEREKPAGPTPREQIMEERGRIAAELASLRQETSIRHTEEADTASEPTASEPVTPDVTEERPEPAPEPRERRPRRDRDSRSDHRRHRRTARTTEEEPEARAESTATEEPAASEPAEARADASDFVAPKLREISDKPKPRRTEPEQEPQPELPLDVKPDHQPEPDETATPEPPAPEPEPVEEHREEKPAEEPERHERAPEPQRESAAEEKPEPTAEPESRGDSESPDEGEKPDQTEGQESAPVHYGRKKHRRGPAPGSSNSESTGESSSEQPEDVKPLDNFPTENVSYGRPRKKRTR